MDTNTSVGEFQFSKVEENVRKLWDALQVRKILKERASNSPKCYFLDGPPYTSGKVHIGTAWNKSLKDMYIRYKRACGFNVWDRAGYDMHGLPTEKVAERQLGLKNGKDEILKVLGVNNFIEKCREVCTQNLLDMNKTFESLGIWMDFENAYQSISRDFMEGEWWFIKTAHEKKRLYEGKRTMTWDAVNATALAKHELEYKEITDTAIYVKFRVVTDSPVPTYVVIWTTTPWTVPLNLAVMVNSKLTYCKVSLKFKGEDEVWIVAEARLTDLLESKLGVNDYKLESKFLGAELAGLKYNHPLEAELPVLSEYKLKYPNVHSLLLADEYVTVSEGTGLVHCAPGCGTEDYEVGHANKIPPLNPTDEFGVYQDFGCFTGWRAKIDDAKFIKALEDVNCVVYSHPYTHKYAHGERSKEPVIYRTTSQWFLKVEDLKTKLVEANEGIEWTPKAAYNSFKSWLEGLRDNSISKQRFWGTPLPIWKNVDYPDEYVVVGSAKELAELAGLKEPPQDLHISTVDNIGLHLTSAKDGKVHEFRRVPDVLDVWVDAGTTTWNSLGYPFGNTGQKLEDWLPVPFILEGKDQIRGWFNLLHVMSMIMFDRPAFKAAYMHGFMNDAEGRKMNKSQGNFILPSEVTEKYGVDVFRYYVIGAANPGLDLNYNFKDMDVTEKNLRVYWNVHKYVLEFAKNHQVKPLPIDDLFNSKSLDVEEVYCLSKLHTAVKKLTSLMENHLLNEVPKVVEEFILDLSHSYLQQVWVKATNGTEEDRVAILSTVLHSVVTATTMFAIVCPFFSEQVYQNLKEAFPTMNDTLFPQPSVHLLTWPKYNDSMIRPELDKQFHVAQDVITAVLAARDRANLGVKWPVREVRLQCPDHLKESVELMKDLIVNRTNIKEFNFKPVNPVMVVLPNNKVIQKEFGKKLKKQVCTFVKQNQKMLSETLNAQGNLSAPVPGVEGKELTEKHLLQTYEPPESYTLGKEGEITAFLDKTLTKELEQEGLMREVVRRVQLLRKKMKLVRLDKIKLVLDTASPDLREALNTFKNEICTRVGCSEFFLDKVDVTEWEQVSDEQIKQGISFTIGIRRDNQ